MRTVVTVWEGASEECKRSIKNEIIVQGRVSEFTVHMWMRGERKPMHLYQCLIQKAFRKVLGQNIPLTELFPN